MEDAHIYFPKKVLDELRKWAERNRRSVTAETIIAVEAHLANLKTTTKNGKRRR